MRTLVHISDLHFGRVDSALIAPLTDLIRSSAPDVVVVSGDLTQRARSAEFRAARAFLDTLPTPQIIVPGNHDISMHNPLKRFVQPLANYMRHVTGDLQPVYSDAEIVVVGVNTARSLTVKDGRISHSQIADVRARLSAAPIGAVKVVVTHHPFDLPDHFAREDLVRRAPAALQAFSDCGADLLLAGHLHASHTATTALHYPIADYSALAVQAGTATSTRGRGESNSFNIIRISKLDIVIDRFAWVEERTAFECAGSERFVRDGQRWLPQPGAANNPG
ncbi:MAG: metallophosphoesterase [Burkholderiaceae bacterium]